MSSNPCNFCTYRTLQEKYSKLGIPLEIRPEPVVDLEADVNWDKAVGVLRKDTGHWLGWFAELPDHCVC